MKRGKRPVWLLGLLLLFPLLQLACAFPLAGQWECEMNGGTWRRSMEVGQEDRQWCEPASANLQPTQPRPTTQPSLTPRASSTPTLSGTCLAQPHTYTWAYQNVRSSSGSAGVVCNAQWVFTNTGSEPVNLVLYTTFDNGKLKQQSWKTLLLQTGKTHEEAVNRTQYKNGLITYSKIGSFLVVRAVSQCAGFLGDDQQQRLETQSIPLPDFSCP